MTASSVRRLEGRRIALTQPEERSGTLGLLLEMEGAVPIPCATIRIEPPDSFEPLDDAVRSLGRYAWVAFTSANAVDAVLGRMAVAGAPDPFAVTLVAAVGPATRTALEARGVPVAFEPREHRAEVLARTLAPVDGKRVLYPRSDLAGPGFASTLRGRGAIVDEVVAYHTLHAAPSSESLAELVRGVDAVAFTSPSTVRGFLEVGPAWRDLLGGAIVASIGPATSEAARREGMVVEAEAAEHTAEGLVEALVDALTSRPRRARDTSR